MPGPFTTPVALSTPFEPNRNPGFGGVASGIESINVQDAIEEAKKDSIDNDRYALLCSYGGNAGSGRYMEFFPSIDSFEAPIILTTSSRLLVLVARTTAADATCTIGFFDLAVSDTIPVYTITFTAQKTVIQIGTPSSPLHTFANNTQLAIKVTSGSINKPHMYFFLSSSP